MIEPKSNPTWADYLPCDGKVFTVNGVKYTIRAKLRAAKYPYPRDYVDLCAEYKERGAGHFGTDKTWFLDLIQSESKTCERLFSKMQKSLQGENK